MTNESLRADEQRDKALEHLLDAGYIFCATGIDCGEVIDPDDAETDEDGKRYCRDCWKDICAQVKR